MQWFKFYGGDYLGDSKVDMLTAAERSCWLTLLCYASTSGDDSGDIDYIREEVVMAKSGVIPGTEVWKETIGVFTKLQQLGFVTIGNAKVTLLNWKKRQGNAMTSAERVRKHRDNKSPSVTKRLSSTLFSSSEYLKKVPQKQVDEFVKRFVATEAEVRGKAEDLLLWCQTNRKKKKNYRAFLLMALRKDFKERKDEETKYTGL